MIIDGSPAFLLGFGIVSMVLVGASWIVAGYLTGKAPKLNIDVAGLMCLCFSMGFAVSIVIALCTGIPDASLCSWLLGFGILVACGIVNAFQLKILAIAMQKGPNGIIWTIAQSSFVFPFAIGVFCFNTPVGEIRAAGFALVIISLILFGIGGNNESKGNWKPWALLAFVVTGGSQTLSNLPSYFEAADPITTWWRTSAFMLGLMAGSAMTHFHRLPEFFRMLGKMVKQPIVLKLAALNGFVNLFASLFFLFPGMNALEKANAGAIAYPIMVSSCLIVFELYTVIFLREKRSFVQLLALLLCIAGAVGIAFK